MARENKIEVQNREKWQISYAVSADSLVHIGSSPQNQIVLPGIESRHAQLIPASGNRQNYLLVNLTSAPIKVRLAKGVDQAIDQSLEHGTKGIEISDGACFEIGGYKLILRRGDTTSAVIALELILPDAPLAPGDATKGSVKITYTGDKPEVAFDVKVTGPAQPWCKFDDAAPVLQPNAKQRTVGFTLQLPATAPPLAGPLPITIEVSAPKAYPDEVASVSRTIQVKASFKHTIGSPKLVGKKPS